MYIDSYADRVVMVVGFLQLSVQSVPITTKVVSSNVNPVNGEVYLIQHYVIKFVSDCNRSVVFYRYSCFLYQQN